MPGRGWLCPLPLQGGGLQQAHPEPLAFPQALCPFPCRGGATFQDPGCRHRAGKVPLGNREGSWPWVGEAHTPEPQPCCPQGVMTPWRKHTSQDLSWKQPELTVTLPRACQGTESEYGALPHWALGDLGAGGGTVGSHLLHLWPFSAAQLSPDNLRE